jgi:chromate reductase
MSEHINILGISGSLRRASANSGLLRAAAALTPVGVTLTIHDLSDVPLYNGDEDGGAAGQPEGALRLKAAIAAADAILIATPEYSHSIPGVLKNALDWASRPMGGSPMPGKPVAILGTGGMSGTIYAQLHLREVLLANNLLVLNRPEVHVTRFWEKFDKAGNLTDEETRTQVGALVEALVVWTKRLRAAV